MNVTYCMKIKQTFYFKHENFTEIHRNVKYSIAVHLNAKNSMSSHST